MLDLGAPVGVYDDTGTSCLTHMIEKMPDVASSALDQFRKVDKASRTIYYYLSYLETYKWKMLRMNSSKGSRLVANMEPLEVSNLFWLISPQKMQFKLDYFPCTKNEVFY